VRALRADPQRDTSGRGSRPTRARFRAETLRWHGAACAACGSTEGVEAAHRGPLDEGGSNDGRPMASRSAGRTTAGLTPYARARDPTAAVRSLVLTMTVEEALARVRAWEREHGHTAERAHRATWYSFDLGEPRITEDQRREGASRWLDYREALRNEEHQRRLAEAERSEAIAEDIADFLRRNP
jgi:hypothetical protein